MYREIWYTWHNFYFVPQLCLLFMNTNEEFTFLGLLMDFIFQIYCSWICKTPGQMQHMQAESNTGIQVGGGILKDSMEL